MMGRIIWISISLFLLTTSIFGQDQYSYIGFESPVSVTQYGGYYYLSNAGNGKDLSVADGDGYISRIKSDGSQEEATMKYITGLDNPRGMLAHKGTLYICDINRVVGFDLKSKKKVFEVKLDKEGTRQLTDIVSYNNNILYVSATDINMIFEINIEQKKYKQWVEAVAPTGMLLDKDQMYVCSWGTDSIPNGKLGVIGLKSKKYTQLANDEGYLWGLALDGKKLYFSDWVAPGKRGVIKWVNLETSETGQIKLTSRIGGPADFLYESRNDIFIIPAMTEGVVYGAIGFK